MAIERLGAARIGLNAGVKAGAKVGALAAVLALAVGGCEEQSSSSGGGGGGGGSSTSGSPSLRPQSVAGRADMSGIAQAVKAFQVNMERLPTTAEGLAVLVSDAGLERDQDKWQGPYIASMDLLRDTYGNQVEYEQTGDGFLLRSLGADGQRGGSGSSADIELVQGG